VNALGADGSNTAAVTHRSAHTDDIRVARLNGSQIRGAKLTGKCDEQARRLSSIDPLAEPPFCDQLQQARTILVARVEQHTLGDAGGGAFCNEIGPQAVDTLVVGIRNSNHGCLRVGCSPAGVGDAGNDIVLAIDSGESDLYEGRARSSERLDEIIDRGAVTRLAQRSGNRNASGDAFDDGSERLQRDRAERAGVRFLGVDDVGAALECRKRLERAAHADQELHRTGG
jgi:hypothetical protein